MKFYLDISAKVLSKKFLYSVPILVVVFNFVLRLFPDTFFEDYGLLEGSVPGTIIVPKELFGYCDVYLLLLFIIIVYFALGLDFTNSMEDVTLIAGGSKLNMFMLRKFFSLLCIYVPLYIITYINVYSIYLSRLKYRADAMPLKQVIFYSVTANVFIIAMSLFILFLTREVTVSTVIIVSYYLIEEYLLRAKVMGVKGVIGQVYDYFEPSRMNIDTYKIWYIAASVPLFFLAAKLCSKKYIFFKLK